MKKVKTIIATIALFALMLGGCVGVVYADDACSLVGENDPLLCGNPGTDEERELELRLGEVLNTVYLWVGVVAVIFIVIGGIFYMTSAGDSEKTKRAKSTITYSVVGLVITVTAFAITSFIIGAVEGRSPNDTVAHSAPSDEERKIIKAVTMIDSTEMQIDDTARLRAKVIPDYAEDKSLVWSTDNEDVVSVDENGVITANKAGTATITVKTVNDKIATTKVKVLEEIKVKTIKVSPTKVSLMKGKTQAIKATVLPINAKDKTLTWSSADKKVAKVSSSGVITAVKAGKTTVTVKSKNNVKATVKVTVTEYETETTGSQTDVPLNGKPNLRKATQKIIDDHRMDFYYSTFDSYMRKNGGYSKYIKNLGGVFTKFAGKSKIPVKTAADFQEVAEYAYGLMMIWGGDYNGGHLNAWRNSKPWKNGKTDRFRSSFGGYKFGDRKESIYDKLKDKNDTNYVCSTMLGNFRSSTNLKYYYIEDENRRNLINKFGSIKDPTKLQVGDVLLWSSMDHVALVGEVYKDYVVIYDGGSKFTVNGKYKFKIYRKSSQSAAMRGTEYGGGSWDAIRPWKIDQSVTLKGIN